MRVSNQLPPSLLQAMLSRQSLSALERFATPTALKGAAGKAIGLSAEAAGLRSAGNAQPLPGLHLGLRVNQPRLFELLQARAERRQPAAFDLAQAPPPPAPPQETAQISPEPAQSPPTQVAPAPEAAPAGESADAPAPADSAADAAPAATQSTAYTRDDLVGLLREYGASGDTRAQTLQYDLDGDGSVGPGDLLSMLTNIDTSGPDGGALSSLLRAFGARSGQARYDASMDYDGDGVIGPSDLLSALAGGDVSAQPAAEEPTEAEGHDDAAPTSTTDDAGESAPTRAFTQDDIDKLLAEYGQTELTRGGPLSYDLDGDGVVGPSDLLTALAGFSGDQAAPQTALDAVKSLYGARSGDDRFNTTFDYDNNGEIGPGDLLRALADVGSVVG